MYSFCCLESGYFSSKNLTYCDLKSLIRIRLDAHCLASWIRIRTEIKSWTQIRIETNADPQHGYKIHCFCFGENTKTLAWIVAEGRFLECAVATEVGRGNNERHLFRILLEVSVPQVPHRRGANFRFELGRAVPAQKRFAVTFWFKFSRGVKQCQTQKLVLWISIGWIHIQWAFWIQDP